ncbi:MAG: GGDEF domain-containing protein [Nitrosomonadales bacterium]|nr:GGDEF domain-containing protein [Nitrosomonadales bacterium]
MATLTNPSDIARETLKTLAARKIIPTPDNYARVYQEIGGAGSGAPGVAAPQAQPGGQEKPAPVWSRLIRDLLKQLETPHKGITLTRKRDGLETVLNKFAANPDALFEKLQALVHSWSSAPVAPGSSELVPAVLEPSAAAPAPSGSPQGVIKSIELTAQLRELLAQALESSLGAQPELADEIRALAQQARAAGDHGQVARLSKQLRQFWIKLELRSEDKEKIQEGVVRLLRLLVENIGELATDEKWVHGQILTLQEIISQPMDKRTIADAERNLRNAIIEQGFLKQSLNDAKVTLKSLMTTFIDNLGGLTESTGAYHTKIFEYSQRIRGADNLAALSKILDEVMHDTRVIQDSAQRSHEELLVTRKQAQQAEDRVRQLEQELEQTSELVHADQLTGALNRRGLDETLEREIKRADRQQAPVSLVMLDIDNFKQLNDTLGHQAGDRALVHLTRVIKETLRPTDAVARYGGEEFIIVLPDTGLAEAVETITRLQRELTKKFFLNDNKRLLITFSAGVALRAENEEAEVVIGRADKAMYQAKKSGKNRVLPAE